jgi:UDP-N-acetylmuramoyl-L-alanyl-D-glutamate--2,6-diaminopimelate ligase
MVFTNLGHDHLSYHGGLENYQKAKSRLFTEYASAEGKRPVCAINIDDSFGAYLATIAEGEIVTYGLKKGDIRGSNLAFNASGIEGKVGEIPIRSSLLGAHNIYNILGAIALSRKIGISSESIADGISCLSSIPGRLEWIDNKSGIDVFVDYAHTPESVSTTLVTVRQMFSGRRLVAVIGCGGNRDRSKRPVMARIAVKNSSVCIFTSDNPRQENPMAIIEDMLDGVHPEELIKQGRLKVIVDRRQAIHRGVEMAKNGGVLVILGKGHERFQIVGDEAISFDDREVAVEALQCQAKRVNPSHA